MFLIIGERIEWQGGYKRVGRERERGGIRYPDADAKIVYLATTDILIGQLELWL